MFKIINSLLRKCFKPAYKLLEFPRVYSFIQNFGSVHIYSELISENIYLKANSKVLDLGCGTGSFREYFCKDYYGIDINSKYIVHAQSKYNGHFEVMDCTNLKYEDSLFDHVVIIATLHHLDDDQVNKTVMEGLRVCNNGGFLHIIDPILPEYKLSLFKLCWFLLDRGKFQRSFYEISVLIKENGKIFKNIKTSSYFHDVTYLRIGKK
tara:strand:+ start:381 stop:1004 length:624 start_codon:yes stop_codon:yes gene_type:complete